MFKIIFVRQNSVWRLTKMDTEVVKMASEATVSYCEG